MKQKFTDPRLALLNDEGGFDDTGMRNALVAALEPGERAVAAYSVSAHIWVEAVLTDRALLLVKGAIRARVIRMPLPIAVTRSPGELRQGVRVRTPLGKKTLWSSKLDPEAKLLLRVADTSVSPADPGSTGVAAPSPRVPHPDAPASEDAPAGLSRRQARRAAGRRPRKPKRPKVRRQWVGFPPSSTVWDLADFCVKCGRPLTDPRSRQARVGTKCIQIYGSQQRRIPNPQHSVWVERKTKVDVAYAADKARADAQFARDTAAHDEKLAQWKRARAAHRP